MPYTLKLTEDGKPPDGAPPHLQMALEVSVRMRLADMTEGTIPVERCRDLSQVIAEHGDIIMYRSKKKGESARAFNALAEALTYATLVPGGIRFMGLRWVASPVRTGMR